MLLAGVGVSYQTPLSIQYPRRLNPSQHVTPPPDAQKNFLVVDARTETAQIEAAFERFTTERKDIAILLINQHVRSAELAGAITTFPGTDPRHEGRNNEKKAC
jgi:vacuolar-type H+-ATPase subunit F/Vma7